MWHQETIFYLYRKSGLRHLGALDVQDIGGADAFFGASPPLDLEILGVLNASILPISSDIGSAIAPLAPP